MKKVCFAIKIAAFVATLFLGAGTASAFYDPGMQRWLNRDPLGERGFEAIREATKLPMRVQGSSLYTFAANNPISNCDYLGLSCRCDHSTDSDLKSCLGCAEQNDAVNRATQAIEAGAGSIGAGAGDLPMPVDGINGGIEIINISDLDSDIQRNLYRGALAKAFLNCLSRWGLDTDSWQIARGEFNRYEHLGLMAY